MKQRRRTIRTGIITRTGSIAAVLLLLTGVFALPATATFPGVNGRIVFYRTDNQNFAQLWTANPDLTAAHQITTGNADSGFAVWSPDASRIAFDSDRTDPNLNDDVVINDVFTMRPDGSDVRQLTDSLGFSGDPAYSPDGSLIAFDADHGAPGQPSALLDLSIFVMKTDGTGLWRITSPPAGSDDTEPRFSPDGSRLVFSRFQGGQFVQSAAAQQVGRMVGDTSAIFTVNLDGTGVHRITGWGVKTGQADWSPDGSRIVFEQACCRLGTTGIYTVGSAGGAVTTVVNGQGFIGTFPRHFLLDGYYDPVWSPDGTKILAGHETQSDTSDYRSGLVLVNPDGTDLHWASPNVDGEHQPDWGTAALQ